ncbi:MAG: lysostaphin resistance A-like protein [Propionibacteriaceae bacterium]|nr:lysostaphin resistance A-like protein [Propionibacteriaceae bacterium]
MTQPIPMLSGLPVDEQTYPRFARGPRWRPSRGVFAVLCAVAAGLLANVVFAMVGMAIDAHGRASQMTATISGPGGFIGNNLGLASWVLIAMGLAGYFFLQPRGYLSSVTGRFRWGWFRLCAVVILPVWVVIIGGSYLLAWHSGALVVSVRSDTWVLLAGIILTTPLQCAGEEYAFRGLINRSVACLVPNRRIGLALGAVVSSGLFMLAHNAQDPWLNSVYFYFGLASCWTCWRTGGLEGSFALHLVNNMASLLIVPFTGGLGAVFDRVDGTSSIGAALLQAGIITVAVALIEVVRRRRRPVREAAPGRALLPPPVWNAPPSSWPAPSSWPVTVTVNPSKP